MSKIVHIEGTEDTPSILLDPVNNEIRIKGISMPENAFEFYDPIEKKALEIFKNTKATLLIEIELFYMNSMSNKQVLKLIKQISDASSQVKVNWRYAPGDTLIKMKGEEIRSICSNLEVQVQETT